MEITHQLKNSVQNVTADTAAFDITTNCHAIIFDNNGDDDANLYFNADAANAYVLKAGTSLQLKSDGTNEILTDTVKIAFITATNKLINIIKQTKSLITN